MNASTSAQQFGLFVAPPPPRRNHSSRIQSTYQCPYCRHIWKGEPRRRCQGCGSRLG